MIRIILAATVAVFGWVASAQAQACVQPAEVQNAAQSLARLTNGARAAVGRPGLQSSRALSQAAQVLACDIAATGQISHRTRAGQNSSDRVRTAGYRACLVAENLAWGYPRAETIVNGWLSSSGHNRNLLHPRTAEFGIGIAQGRIGPVWVMIYARPC